MRTWLLDVRCLQDVNYAGRGIGRHAMALLDHARDLLPGDRLVGIADRSMGQLPGTVAGLLDAVRHDSYTGRLTGPCCHVQLSPLTHDPLFVARLLHHRDIPSAAVVYDFIPFDEPARYLPHPATRLDYHVGLRWLARHELFMPISTHAAERLHDILKVPAHRIEVTGAAIHPGFETVVPGTPLHVLVVGGGDPRKNPEVVVRAHAGCAPLQAARVPLVVTGGYGEDWVVTQREIAAALGGDPDLVLAPGEVPQDVLLRLFADSLCMVAPSRAEGFSLPVVEAMAAGLPVLASSIPAHRELVQDTLFPPDDDGCLAALLTCAADPAWRETIRQAQSGTWPRFRAQSVAARFWSAATRLMPSRAPGLPHARARVAFLTPLAPARSGVADYSAATCPELGKRVELHVFTPTLDAERPLGVHRQEPLSAFPHVSTGFDRVVSVLGNSVFHLAILNLFRRHGGGVIQHDGRMIDLYASHIDLPLTERMAAAELGRELHPNEIWQWLAGDRPPKAMILGEIAEAEPLMMHSRDGVAEVERRFGVSAAHLPFSLYRPISSAALSPAGRTAARARLGVADEQVLLATFGYLHPTKSPADCLWALEQLRAWGIDARLHFVGAALMDTGPLERLAEEIGVRRHVRFGQGYVDEQDYVDHLVGADVGVQLRMSGVGSVSGALADCAGAGLRTVASSALARAIDAPSYIACIPDTPSPILIAEAAAALLDTPRAEADRLDYAAAHGFDRYADRLCEALAIG